MEQSEAVSKKTFSPVRTVWVREDFSFSYCFSHPQNKSSICFHVIWWTLASQFQVHTEFFAVDTGSMRFSYAEYSKPNKQLDRMNALCVCLCAQYI